MYTPKRRKIQELPFQIPDTVDTVLLDIGNVLTDDFWEIALLSPQTGLAALLNLEHAIVEQAGLGLWPKYCNLIADEQDYWAALEVELALAITQEMRDAVNLLPQANPLSELILTELKALGMRVGIISNNTAFWFPRQNSLIDFLSVVDPDIVFCSHTHGAEKSSTPSLFAQAAQVVTPATTLVVDDRVGNVARAREHGFHAVHYAWKTPTGVI